MAIKLANNSSSVLAASITSSTGVLVLATGDGALFPSLLAGEWFPVTVVADDYSFEVMRVTSRSGDSLTVTRAQENTSAKAFAIGSRVELRLTAGAFVEMIAGKLDRVGGTLTGPVSSSSSIDAKTITVDGDDVWHEGNFNPDTKLNKTGVQTLEADRFTILGANPKLVLTDAGGFLRVLMIDKTAKDLRVCKAIDGTGVIFKLLETGEINTELFGNLSEYITTKANDAATAKANAIQTSILNTIHTTYIEDVRLGAYVNGSIGTSEYGSGYVVTSGNSWRPIQVKRNGSWVTVFNA